MKHTVIKVPGGYLTGRRVSARKARSIARERMNRLLSLAEEEALKGNIERGRRYVELARKIGMRTNTRMPKGFMFCEQCDVPLVPGRNCRVRLRSNHVSIRCFDCGYVKRHPYLEEKRRSR